MSKDESTGRARGGDARAAALSKSERTDIAVKAAQSRWNIQAATHEGPLHIGEMELPAAVLEGGVRVITSAAVMTALKRPWKGSYRSTQLPNFISGPNLLPFINSELRDVLQPIKFRSLRGQTVQGFRAEILPLVCEVYLLARDGGKLNGKQKDTAKQAEMLVRSLSKIGIIALVDEATGYQNIRPENALRELLALYLRKELAAWAKRFPDEFYQQIFRLKGWKNPQGTNRPQVIAYYTKDIVYARLAPKILEELEDKNPASNGRRKAKHHQWLSDDIGVPALSQHMHAVLTLMRISSTWEQFMHWLDTAHPRRGDTLQLPLMLDLPPPKTSVTSSAQPQLSLLSLPDVQDSSPQP